MKRLKKWMMLGMSLAMTTVMLAGCGDSSAPASVESSESASSDS